MRIKRVKANIRTVISAVLAMLLIFTGLPFTPLNDIPVANAGTTVTIVSPIATVYDQYTEIQFKYDDKEHDTSIKIIDPITQLIDEGTYSEQTLYKVKWDGKINGEPAPDDIYTIEVAPTDEDAQYKSEGTVEVVNPNPPAPTYIHAVPDINSDSHYIRGIAERDNLVSLKISYTDGTVDTFDNIQVSNSLTWSKTWAQNKNNLNVIKLNDYLDSKHFTNNDTSPEDHIGEWEIEVTLDPYKIASITAKSIRNIAVLDSKESQTSEVYQVLRYKVPDSERRWAVVASYYYKLFLKGDVEDKLGEIATFNGFPKEVCVDGQTCYGKIDKDKNILIESPLREGLITEKAADQILEEYSNKNGHPLAEDFDPINLATGDFSFFHTNMSLEAKMPLEFKVAYHSRDKYNGDIGVGWHHSYEGRLDELEDGTIYVKTPTGASLKYLPSGNGSYLTPAGVYNILSKNADGTFTLETPQKVKYIYRQDGKLYKIIDSNNNTTILEYYGSILEKVKTEGASLSFTYGKGGKITEVTDHSGRSVHYDYFEETHDLRSITLPDGAQMEFEYDDKHQITQIFNPNKTLSLINEYDDKGRVTRQRDFAGAWGDIKYFPEENKTITIDELDRETTYVYDDRQRQTDIHFPDGTSHHFEYDGNDNLVKFVDRKQNETSFIYDSKGNLLQKIDPLGYKTTFEYNSLNKPTKMIDSEGNETIFGYDSAGNMTTAKNPLGEIVEIQYEQGIPRRIINPNGAVTELDNDSYGFVEKVIDPLGNPVHLDRDSLHRVTKITDALGNRTKINYDPRGRIEERINPLNQVEKFKYDKDSNLVNYTDTAGETTTYTYDSYNRIHTMVDPENNVTTYEYDDVGNLTKEIMPNGATVEYIYNSMDEVVKVIDPEGNITEYEYDDNGNITKVIEPEGGVTKISYDANNRPLSVTNDAGATTIFVYDKLGNILQAKDAEGNITSYEYDALGRATKVTNALGHETTLEYDKLGNVIKTVYPNGAVWKMDYDERGMLTSVTNPLGYTRTMNRDELGRVEELIDEKQNITAYQYDPLHRIKAITNPLGHSSSFTYHPLGMVKGIVDEKGNTTSYNYDALGQLTSVTNALGKTTEYKYDDVGNLIKKINAKGNVTVYDYDLNNQLIEELNPLKQATAFSYDGNGNMKSISYPNGNMIDYQYNSLNQLKKIQYSDGTSVSYNYDILGRRTSMLDAEGQTTYQYDRLHRLTSVTDVYNRTVKYEWTKDNQRSKIVYPDGSTTTYSYDLLGQLTDVTDIDGHITKYEYDPTGLMTKKYLPTGAISSYEYDKLGQITSLTHQNQYGQVLEQLSYEYDPSGNITEMIRKEDEDEDDTDEKVITMYAYDALNQLIEVQKQNGYNPTSLITTAYNYDAVGNRLNKTMSWGEMEIAETYTYDMADKLMEWTDGSQIKNYSYDLSGNLQKVTTEGIQDMNMESVTMDVYSLDSVIKKIAPIDTIHEDVYKAPSDISALSNDSVTEDVYEPEVERFNWNAANRLIQHINPRGDKTQYAYDGDGNRIKMTIDYQHGPKGNNGNGQNNNGNNNNGNDNNNGNNANCHDVPPGFIPPGLAKKCGIEEEPFPDNQKGGPRDGWEKQYKKKHWEFNYTNDVTLALPEPLQVTEADATKWKENYVYGAGGERLSMTYLPAYDDNNGWEPSPGAGGAEPNVIPKTLYYLTDHLGSTIGLLEKDGRMSAKYHYDEFGIPLDGKKFDVNWPGPDNLYGYTGLGYDYSSDLTYARARYYQPEIGRFISEDIYKGNLMNHFSQNPYIYVENNPVLWKDPTGLYTQKSGFYDIWGAKLPNITTDPKKAAENIELAKLKWQWAENQKEKYNNQNEYWSAVQSNYHEWAEAQRKFIDSNVQLNLNSNYYLKAEVEGSFLLSGGGEIKYDGEIITVKIKGSVSGEIGAHASITQGIEISNGELDNKTASFGMGGGTLGYIEGNYKTDGEFWEISTGGGLGAGVEVELVPVMSTRVEGEYTIFTLRAPLPDPGDSYVGTPTAQEWFNMLDGNGWSGKD